MEDQVGFTPPLPNLTQDQFGIIILDSALAGARLCSMVLPNRKEGFAVSHGPGGGQRDDGTGGGRPMTTLGICWSSHRRNSRLV